ncbi:MAG: ferredoxin [Cyanophyceae cyanobacterium]
MSNPIKTVLVCQNRTCRKDGAKKVLAAFKSHDVPDVKIVACGCLGQCGSGPMVLVEPEQVWYAQVQPKEVPVVVKSHLRGNCPVKAMLYPKFHRHQA